MPRSRSLKRADFSTQRGSIYQGDSVKLMKSIVDDESVDLIFTSPPFGLIDQKSYGNERDAAYLRWFRRFAREFHRVLKPSGSLVIDIQRFSAQLIVSDQEGQVPGRDQLTRAPL